MTLWDTAVLAEDTLPVARLISRLRWLCLRVDPLWNQITTHSLQHNPGALAKSIQNWPAAGEEIHHIQILGGRVGKTSKNVLGSVYHLDPYILLLTQCKGQEASVKVWIFWVSQETLDSVLGPKLEGKNFGMIQSRTCATSVCERFFRLWAMVGSPKCWVDRSMFHWISYPLANTSSRVAAAAEHLLWSTYWPVAL